MMDKYNESYDEFIQRMEKELHEIDQNLIDAKTYDSGTKLLYKTLNPYMKISGCIPQSISAKGSIILTLESFWIALIHFNVFKKNKSAKIRREDVVSVMNEATTHTLSSYEELVKVYANLCEKLFDNDKELIKRINDNPKLKKKLNKNSGHDIVKRYYLYLLINPEIVVRKYLQPLKKCLIAYSDNEEEGEEINNRSEITTLKSKEKKDDSKNTKKTNTTIVKRKRRENVDRLEEDSEDNTISTFINNEEKKARKKRKKLALSADKSTKSKITSDGDGKQSTISDFLEKKTRKRGRKPNPNTKAKKNNKIDIKSSSKSLGKTYNKKTKKDNQKSLSKNSIYLSDLMEDYDSEEVPDSELDLNDSYFKDDNVNNNTKKDNNGNSEKIANKYGFYEGDIDEDMKDIDAHDLDKISESVDSKENSSIKNHDESDEIDTKKKVKGKGRGKSKAKTATATESRNKGKRGRKKTKMDEDDKNYSISDSMVEIYNDVDDILANPGMLFGDKELKKLNFE